MGSAFFEFNVATSGIFTSKTGLEVTSHNVANSATVGYSRQIANQRASIPLTSLGGVGMVGTGSEVYSISQVRNFYLDKKYWSQTNYLGEYSAKKDQLDLLEAAFNSLGDSNLSEIFDDFFNNVSSLTFDSGDDTYRTSVVTYGTSLADNINYMANQLIKQQRDINDDIYAVTQKINDLSKQISTINKQIYSYEITGSTANDLRDQRAVLVDELSQYANIDVKEKQGPSGNANDLQYCVFINGQELVTHFDYNIISCEKRTESMNSDDAVGLYNLVWESGKEFNCKGLSGELKGLLDVRDGNIGMTNADNADFKSVDFKGIPYYIDKLNGLVRTVTKSFNEGKKADGSLIDPDGTYRGHLGGYDANGDKGGYFFTYKDDEGNVIEFDGTVPDDYYDNITAFNFCVSQELVENPKLLAASDTKVIADGTNEDISNNNVILKFVDLKNNTGLFKEGSISSYIISVNSSLGIDTKQATNFNEYYTDIVSNVDNQRIQVSGVSMNEEIVNIVRYQQLYQASCQLINAIDEIYDMTINRMGV